MKTICKPLFNNFYLKKATKTTLFEKFALCFITKKTHKDNIENVVTITKNFNGKIYIIDQYLIPPSGFNCRSNIQCIK